MIGIVTDQLFHRHDNGPGHPESPQRLDAVERGILSFTNDQPFLELPAKRASISDIALIHDVEYIEMLEQTQGRERTVIDHETQTNRDSFDTALYAAGSAISATEAIISGECNSAFCAVRPPGHHAEADRGMGFCLFNNAAIATRWALGDGCNRVAILDWDVHHGNGTMHSFYDDPGILYLSVHQYPHYPGTGSVDDIGTGAGRGFTINAPLPPGSSDADYLCVFDRVFLPYLATYSPDLLIVSAGFDAHAIDPLSSIELSGSIFGEFARLLIESMGERGVLFVLEGGYSLEVLEESTEETLRGMAGVSSYSRPMTQPAPQTVQIVDSLLSVCA